MSGHLSEIRLFSGLLLNTQRERSRLLSILSIRHKKAAISHDLILKSCHHSHSSLVCLDREAHGCLFAISASGD
jgi:hypothetical protein